MQTNPKYARHYHMIMIVVFVFVLHTCKLWKNYIPMYTYTVSGDFHRFTGENLLLTITPLYLWRLRKKTGEYFVRSTYKEWLDKKNTMNGLWDFILFYFFEKKFHEPFTFFFYQVIKMIWYKDLRCSPK